MWDDPVLYDLENADDPAFDLAFWSGLIASLRPRRVLELACGTGRLTIPLAGLGVADEVVGLDSSPSFLSRARALDGAGSVTWVEGDMRAPEAAAAASGSGAGEFDLVMVPFNSLAYVLGADDRLTVLRAARRLLPADGGGRFALDLVAPRYDFLAEAAAACPPVRQDADHPAPDLGVARFLRSYVDTYDPATQTLHSLNRYEIHWADGRVEHRVGDVRWHIHFPAELESLLSAAGLRVVARHGGWNGEPWGPAARRILWICEPA